MSRFRTVVANLHKDRFLFFRVQAFITFIILVPIMILGITYYRQSSQALIKNFSESNQETLTQISTSLELIIDNIIDISKQSYNDTRFYEIMNGSTLDNYDDSDYAYKRINQIKNSNRYIYSVYLYIEKSKKVISSAYGITNIEEFNDRSFLKWYGSDERNLILSPTHPVLDYNASDDPKNLLSVNARLPLERVNNFNGALIINIDQSYVYNEVINALKTKKEAPFIVLNEDNKVILSKSKEELYKNFNSMGYSEGDLEGKGGSIVTKLKGKPFLLVYNKLGKRNWTYISLYPFEEINRTIKGTRTLVVVISILLVLLSIAISTSFTLKAMRPVEELIKLVTSRSRKVVNAGNQLNSARDAVFDIFENNEEMKEKLELTVPVFKEKFLYNLVKNNRLSYTEIESRLRSFHIEIPSERLLLILFDIDNYVELLSREGYEENIIKFSIINKIEKFLVERNIKGFTVETDPNCIALIIGAEDIKISELLILLNELQSQVHASTNISLSAGICDEQVEITALKQSYRKATEILKYKILYGKKEILLYSDIKQERKDEYVYPYEKVEFFKNYVKVCDSENGCSTLKEIIDDVEKMKSYIYMQQFIIQFNSSIISLINDLNIPIAQIYTKDNEMFKILNLHSRDDIERFFGDILQKIVSIIEANRESKMDRYFRKIESYVNENYMREITLELASEEINLSPTYINQILRNNTNRTFIQVLNETRVERASELLKDDDIKVKDIAEMVGFSSSKYFIKIFKEIKGVTPGQYKA
jgi:two-component system, response regulator YesN